MRSAYALCSEASFPGTVALSPPALDVPHVPECKWRARRTSCKRPVQVSVDQPFSVVGESEPHSAPVLRRPRVCEHDNDGATAPIYISLQSSATHALG